MNHALDPDRGMDVWVLALRPHYTAATTVAPEMIYGWNLLRNGGIIAFMPYRTDKLEPEHYEVKPTHCSNCGRKLMFVRYRCPTCGELQCSEECRRIHIKTMDAV